MALETAIPKNQGLPEYDYLRRRLQNQNLVKRQEAQNAMQRRFARFGGLNSGAYLNNQQELDRKLAREEENADAQLTAQEMQTRRLQEEANKQREFVSGESEKQRQFQGAQFEKDFGLRQDMAKFAKYSKLREMDMQERYFQNIDMPNTILNRQLVQAEMDRPTDIVGQMFGGGIGGVAGGAITGAAIGSVVPGIGTVAGGVGGGLLGLIPGLSRLCFAAGTKIKLANGETKNIEDIKVGDKTYIGGDVYMIGEGISDDLYSYNDVLVTGSHAVFEDGKFIRVEDSKKAVIKRPVTKIPVYFFSNENHRIIIGDTVFADYDEHDEGNGVSEEDSLDILNFNYQLKED